MRGESRAWRRHWLNGAICVRIHSADRGKPRLLEVCIVHPSAVRMGKDPWDALMVWVEREG